MKQGYLRIKNRYMRRGFTEEEAARKAEKAWTRKRIKRQADKEKGQ